MQQLIPVISAHDLVALYAPIDGFSSHCALADLTDHDGVLRRVYIKFFAPDSNGLAGETVRWTLASALAVPQPARAWLVQTPARMLAALWPEIEWQIEWDNELIPGFATLQIDAPAPTRRIAWFQDPVLRERLSRWTALHEVVALDEWTANDDGNLGNLIYISHNDTESHFATIDGGRILAGEHWTIESLERLRPGQRSARIHNKLARAAFGPEIGESGQIKILQAARHHHAALEASNEHLLFWLMAILDDARLALSVMSVLRERAPLPWLERRPTYVTHS